MCCVVQHARFDCASERMRSKEGRHSLRSDVPLTKQSIHPVDGGASVKPAEPEEERGVVAA